MADFECQPHTCAAKISPSLLACDLANLASESERVIAAGADWLHIDVMDGHFVPNLTWGAPVVKCLRKNLADAFFDVHLMVSNPQQWVGDMAAAGANMFTFHLESLVPEGAAADAPAVHAAVQAIVAQIREAGMQVGITIKPGTPVDALFPFVELVDMVLIMTVEPGFGGQSFMPDMMGKVHALRERHPNLDIQVDGGLSPKTIDTAAKAGANVIVAGSAVFKAEDMASVIGALRSSVAEHGNKQSA